MQYDSIEPALKRLASSAFIGVHFCEEESRFRRENSELSPGAFISRYGFWVIGTTIGGNAITLSNHDEKVRYCDHTGWYDDYMCAVAHKDYTEQEYSVAHVENAQVVLAISLADFERICAEGTMESMLDELD